MVVCSASAKTGALNEGIHLSVAVDPDSQRTAAALRLRGLRKLCLGRTSKTYNLEKSNESAPGYLLEALHP